ncbi:MAG: ABC transporter substrate-binding protein, partial [Acidimicrobiia bacterium]|nr:ABC transporter substrate-binding protein [Acidimicrobiia bacterium]
ALVAGACGGDDGGGEATGQTVDRGVAEGVGAALGGPSTTAGGTATTELPDSMEAWEALADAERAAIVQMIRDNGWGKSADGTTVTGPEGFTIDLTACPPGWSDTEGLTESEIKIGHTAPLSGTAADFGNGGRALEAVLGYYSDQGVFTDAATGTTRRINLILKDDAYDSARTIPLVDELIDSEKVFAMTTTGSPTTLKVYDKLNERCIAHPLGGITGHPAWADPVNHPWTTGLQMAYSTEAVLWGAFIEQRIDEFPGEKIKIASLVTSNDYGQAYDTSFRAYLDQSVHNDRFEYVSESIEITAPTVTDPMTTLAAGEPDVFILMGGASQCTQVVHEVAQNGMRDRAQFLITNQNCKGFMTRDKVGGDGEVASGWWIMGGGVRDINSPAEDGNPYVQWARDVLTSAGIDHRTSSNFSLGIEYAFPLVQGLRIAGELDGGLTRTNLMVALRAMEMTHPMLLPGIQFNLRGNADAYFIEGSDISQYDAAGQEWVPTGGVIDLSGKSKNCAFDQSTQTCN